MPHTDPTSAVDVDAPRIDSLEHISFSPAGRSRAAALLAELSPEAAVRVYVKSGGCSGYSYGMAIDERHVEGDRIFADGGARVVVDPKSWALLRGSEIDYVENMMGGGFHVTNPNATSACGCGSSFRTDGRAVPEGEGSGGCGS